MCVICVYQITHIFIKINYNNHIGVYLYDYYRAYRVEYEQGTPRHCSRQGLSYHPYHDFLPPPFPTLSTTLQRKE